MVRYNLHCEDGHTFDAWFSTSKSYDDQVEAGQVECPMCGSSHIGKSMMAPNISLGRGKRSFAVEPTETTSISADVAHMPLPQDSEKIRQAFREVHNFIKNNAVDVGKNFASEARKMHYEDKEPRGIYGEATVEEIVDLEQEGINVMPMPANPTKKT